MENYIFSLDIGTRSVIGTVGIVKDKKFHVVAESYTEHEERAMIDGQIQDINLVALAVSRVKLELEEKLNTKLTNVSIAAAGRFLRTTEVKAKIDMEEDKEINKDIIRGLELTAVKMAEDKIKKDAVGKLYCVGYSVKNYYLNGYIISNLLAHKGENIESEVIATFLPRSVIDSLYSVMNKVGLNVTSLTLEPIAAMEAAIPQNLRLLNLALVDIGAGTSDVAISSKDTISAYGMVSTAGDEVTEAIAKYFLIDFNSAEKLKRQYGDGTEKTIVDIIGLENVVKDEEILKVILPTVEKIGTEISAKILELNGGKSPNAVFLVGGGAHTPGIREVISEKLNIPLPRIAIKGRDAVVECVCIDNSLGSTGVTVLGIALVAIKKSGNDFMDVTLNDNVVSLFNSHKNTVMDAIMQGGINPKVLFAKNGKNVKFTLNGEKRVAFGNIGKSSVIKINGKIGSIDSEIKEGADIKLQFAKNGKDAKPKLVEYLNNINAISFFIDNEIRYMEPVIFINDVKSNIDTAIKNGDNIKIVYPSTLKDFNIYYSDNQEDNYYFENVRLKEDYVINEGDRIVTKINDIPLKIEETTVLQVEKTIEEVKVETKKHIEVYINDNLTKLEGKDNYIFVDLFNYIKFDLTIPRGELVLLLNGNKAGFYDSIKDKDKIEIGWK